MSKNSSNNQNLVNIISKNTIIDGSIRSESDVRVDGTVKGTLITKAKVVVGQGGVVEGDVASNNAAGGRGAVGGHRPGAAPA